MRVTAQSVVRSDRGGRSRTRPGPRGDPAPTHGCAGPRERTRKRRPSSGEAKDGAGRLEASQSTGRPTRESPPASGDNETRTPGWRSGSRGEGRAAAGLELLVG